MIKLIKGIVTCVLLLSIVACTHESNQENADKNIKIGDQFVLIEGGTFDMGSPETEAQRETNESLHTVTLDAFYMSAYEVTQSEYQKIMNENPSEFSGENLPVENVTWYDAIKYCNELSKQEGLSPVYEINNLNVSWNRNANGYRLPTEAEWEYAARASTTTPFNTETSIGDDEANYYGHYPYLIEENYFSQDKLETKPGKYRQTTTEVGSFPANKWKLYDMHGNVREWCWDYYGEYDLNNLDNPTGSEDGNLRVVRGGGWNDYAKHLRSAYRSSKRSDQSESNTGFRLVRNANKNVSGTVKTTDSSQDFTEITGAKTLIVYFSWGGNTEGIANEIQSMVNSDIFEIQLEQPYSSDYNTVLNEAQRDLNKNARPKLSKHIDDINRYDAIILGYPNWWATIPMPIASFLDEYDLSGKRIVPFCSHGGGRLGESINDISKLEPDAVIGEPLGIHYSGDANLQDEIREWLNQNKIK